MGVPAQGEEEVISKTKAISFFLSDGNASNDEPSTSWSTSALKLGPSSLLEKMIQNHESLRQIALSTSEITTVANKGNGHYQVLQMKQSYPREKSSKPRPFLSYVGTAVSNRI